ncbi:MAG: hypothetical protein WDN67_02785 [Candidatus Moraniibacteriota bacterium]
MQSNTPHNIIVVNNPHFEASANALVKDLGGEIGELPEGQKADPEASLQIFLNQEFALEER